MNQILHIYGPSGSGTSTLAAALSARTGVVHLEADDYLWQPTDPPYTTKRDAAERLRLLKADVDRCSRVIIAGSIVGWGDALRPTITYAVRLYAPTDLRLQRIKQRELLRFGARILPGGDMYETQQAFYRWAAGYDTGGTEMRSIAQYERWETGLHCPRILLDGMLPVETLTETVQNFCRGMFGEDGETKRL